MFEQSFFSCTILQLSWLVNIWNDALAQKFSYACFQSVKEIRKNMIFLEVCETLWRFQASGGFGRKFQLESLKNGSLKKKTRKN